MYGIRLDNRVRVQTPDFYLKYNTPELYLLSHLEPLSMGNERITLVKNEIKVHSNVTRSIWNWEGYSFT